MTSPDQMVSTEAVVVPVFSETAERPFDRRVIDIQSVNDTPEAQLAREQAWASIYLEYGTKLTHYAQCIHDGDVDAAEDTVQETFVKAFKNIDRFTYQGPESLGFWLSRITRNAAVDHLRKNGRTTVADAQLIEQSSQPHVNPQPDSRTDPFARIAFQETMAELEEEMPDSQHSALLASVMGLTPLENASLHHVSESSITGLIHRGRYAAQTIIKRAA